MMKGQCTFEDLDEHDMVIVGDVDHCIHFDTFRLGKEPIGDAMRRLTAAAGDQADRIVIRRVGDSWSLASAAR